MAYASAWSASNQFAAVCWLCGKLCALARMYEGRGEHTSYASNARFGSATSTSYISARFCCCVAALRKLPLPV